MKKHLLLSALILALVGYVIIYMFDLRGSLTWVVYGCVVGLPLIVIPFITNKPAPDVTRFFVDGEEFFDAVGGRRKMKRRT